MRTGSSAAIKASSADWETTRAPIFYFMSLLWFASQTLRSRTFTCAATLSYLQLRSPYVEFSGSPHTQIMLDGRLNCSLWVCEEIVLSSPGKRLQPLEAHVVVGLRSTVFSSCLYPVLQSSFQRAAPQPRCLLDPHGYREAAMARSFSTKAWIRSQLGCGGSSCCLLLRRCKFSGSTFFCPSTEKLMANLVWKWTSVDLLWFPAITRKMRLKVQSAAIVEVLLLLCTNCSSKFVLHNFTETQWSNNVEVQICHKQRPTNKHNFGS